MPRFEETATHMATTNKYLARPRDMSEATEKRRWRQAACAPFAINDGRLLLSRLRSTSMFDCRNEFDNSR
jgi:hypothetical protein